MKTLSLSWGLCLSLCLASSLSRADENTPAVPENPVADAMSSDKPSTRKNGKDHSDEDPSKSPPSGQAFTFYIENDARRLGGPGSDQAYSNGFKFAYTYAEDKIPTWFNPVTFWAGSFRDVLKKPKTNFGLSLAQQLYTPGDTSDPNFINDDRPYAAWLYVGFAATIRTETRSHSFELDVGTVGSNGYGRQVQNGFHRIIGVPEAQGWDNQIKNEPTLQLSYQQRLRFRTLTNERRNYIDVIPYFGGTAGNVQISAQVGGVLRAGYNLPDDFGPARPSALDGDSYVDPSYDYKSIRNWSLYGFVGAKANAVGRNMFLDGNTVDPNHRVTKYPITGETEFGFGARMYHWSYVWRFVTRSPEFEQKSKFNSFASISITYSSATDALW